MRFLFAALAALAALTIGSGAFAQPTQVPITSGTAWSYQQWHADNWVPAPPPDYIQVEEVVPVTNAQWSCEWTDIDVEFVPPRAEWDSHLDETGRWHLFQWLTPEDKGISYSAVANAYARCEFRAQRGFRYDVAAIIRSDVPELSNTVDVQVLCAGEDMGLWRSDGNWPPTFTSPATADCHLLRTDRCAITALPAGNTRVECHNDLYVLEREPPQPTSCGIGPGLAMLLPLWWAVRRIRNG